jgi:hypothetical protein
MAKKRAIVSYDKLTAEQKREINKAFPDGYGTNMTTIKTPTGETLDALIWETDDIIYLVKIIKNMTSALDDDDDDEEEDDIDDLIKPDDLEEDDDDEDDLPKKSKKVSFDDDEDDIDDIADDEEDEDED